jgi:hypothetical protein
MTLNLLIRKGIGLLNFGQSTKQVETLLGKPDLAFDDEDFNKIWLYNALKLRLTFYADEDFKLGYLICSHPDMTLFEEKIYQKSIDEVLNLLKTKGIQTFEEEQFDSVFNYFNEDHWLIVQSEFGCVIKIELGVVAKNMDEFDWQV